MGGKILTVPFDGLPLDVGHEHLATAGHDDAAGLRLRPLAETASGCLDSPVTALSPEREAEVLAAWQAR